jgi:chemotaxis protein methyltransferase CheR
MGAETTSNWQPAALEFDFTPGDFARVRALIREHAGIHLQADKQTMMYSRLAPRLRETGHRSGASYLRWLEQSTHDREWQQFINCLTTNLTSFFREHHHFEILAAALKGRPTVAARIWCNAASSGEEAYTIAMTVVETLGPQADVHILATDIDTNMLAIAERGIYKSNARGLTEPRLRKHFMRGSGSKLGLMRVKPSLARLVAFRPFNLIDERGKIGDTFDFVFCRNVMIYFDALTQRSLLERMHAVMNAGALLFVGHAENLSESDDLFRVLGQTVYERV